ncbi:hypothetical protein [Chryseobacterium sp. BIGb0232]|uniref:hypothetical protein n=1 Tax=Chryseobacterium sp. BIGb0232 TaxID=2940598 RepID=UPI000F944B3B|nr:hypothetical protein [Chryseobacterium sp. BIGb0232]MCS4303477.1 hypothetical protein [Chryseobacterium sp. BIGb0232]ROS11252.1 hypothetical protein EDF65_3656 [Chryseobacterium nakagawai]
MENSIKIGNHYYDINSDHFRLEWGESLSNFSELSYLSQFPNLRSATFTNTNLNDEGLAHVSDCSMIDNLNLQDTEITNEGIQYLQNLYTLRYLRLKDNLQLTDECVPYLIELESLENLEIQETSITENGLKKLTALKYLEKLSIYVQNNNYTFEGLLQISRELPKDCELLAKGNGSFYNGEFKGTWKD